MHDVIIIGSGSAGYTAAIYACRAGRKTLILAGSIPGGQLMITSDVENFPGFPEGVLGPELMEKLRRQAEKFGPEIIYDDVSFVDFSSRPFKIVAGGKSYEWKSVAFMSMTISENRIATTERLSVQRFNESCPKLKSHRIRPLRTSSQS